MEDDNSHDLVARLKASGISHTRIAEAIGRAQPAATRLLNGQRALKVSEIGPLTQLLSAHKANAPHNRHHPKFLDDTAGEIAEEKASEYLSIDVLPTFAGMGGGGTGAGDSDCALIPRRLIEIELRGRASDFILVNVRGDSMEPDFYHGDQILIDRRDRSPVQPGPFALRYEDGYVIKNVEQTQDGVRIFSTNAKYSAALIQSPDFDIEIIGRPVWFGRRI